jgi:hypothetical protein
VPSTVTHCFHEARVAEVVKHALFGHFLDHVQGDVQGNHAGFGAERIHRHLQQIIVGEVSETPRVVGVEAAREAWIGAAEHGLHLVLVTDHDDSAVFSRRARNFFHNRVQNLTVALLHKRGQPQRNSA